MKEIVYIQAGVLSNYTGTHFWNTQESYLNDDELVDEYDIESGISFCESVDARGGFTLCPRLLIIDQKSNFGNLASCKALEELEEDADGLPPALWNGELVEYRQELIPKSNYQIRMEEETSNDVEFSQKSIASIPANQDGGDVRYWSDFSRVYYLPGSLQRLPDPSDWEATNNDWNSGQELFSRFNEESELMDGSLRRLIEDCDNIQGVQIMNDTDTFGSFMSSFLASFRDDYLKLPSFAFATVSGGVSQTLDIDDIKNTRNFVNEALYLRTLNEFSSMNIPIREPAVWPSSVWDEPLHWPPRSVYHQSAILSAHVETSTLPFRLKSSHESISSVCGQLKQRGTTPFGELGGAFPVTRFSNLEDIVVNFSSDNPVKSSGLFAQMDVTRGFSSRQIGAYDEWSSRYRSPMGHSITRIHGAAYPLPSSFPPFRGQSTDLISDNHSNGFQPPTLPTAQVLSSLSTSSNTAHFIEEYALFIEKCVKQRTSSIVSIGVSLDDLKDLANDLWSIHDNSSENNEGFNV